ncbi:MAG: mannosyltransferase family protein [Actinomycetota bacterium]
MWRSRLQDIATRAAIPLGIFLASRLAVLAAAYAAVLVGPEDSLIDVLGRWDGAWYLRLAERGYPHAVPVGVGNPAQSTLAFLPGYPLLVRGLMDRGVYSITAGVVVSTIASTVAAVALWFLVQRLSDRSLATRSVALWSFFPGAQALSMVYADGLFLLLAILCLHALLRERWVVAGVTAALAGAVRPNGMFLVACCLWAAVVALRAGRGLRALTAPLLAPLGALAFFTYLFERTGDPLAWPHAQARGWAQGVDFGWSAVTNVVHVARGPLDDFNLLASGLTFVALIAAMVLLTRWRPPVVLVIYTLAIAIPVIISRGHHLTPRTFVIAFPLLIATARAVRGSAFAGLLAASASLMAVLALLAGATVSFTP